MLDLLFAFLKIVFAGLVYTRFKRTAEKRGRKATLWGFVGLSSFYLPLFFAWFLIVPIIFQNNLIELESTTSEAFLRLLLQYLPALGCCAAAYILLSVLLDVKRR